MTNTTATFFIIDRNSVAHTTVGCEEYHAPAITRLMGDAVIRMHLLVCADCEPDD